MSEPNTMMPATAATQNVRRAATCRSYRGLRTRRWRMTKAIRPTSATAASPSASVPLLGTAAKLIARISAATSTTDSVPCLPMSGNATFATDRLRLATPATRISATRTSPARSGASDGGASRGAPGALIAASLTDLRARDLIRSGWSHGPQPVGQNCPRSI
jgi:hypothetical protein